MTEANINDLEIFQINWQNMLLMQMRFMHIGLVAKEVESLIMLKAVLDGDSVDQCGALTTQCYEVQVIYLLFPVVSNSPFGEPTVMNVLSKLTNREIYKLI